MTAESEILQSYISRLQDLLRGSMISVSAKALTAKLLTPEEQEKCTLVTYTDSEKVNYFCQYITRRVNRDPSALRVFLNEVLKKDPAFEEMGKEIGNAVCACATLSLCMCVCACVRVSLCVCVCIIL